ncbi:hypothetical protein FOZ60_003278 [Perkinsus olseni]|uniref:RNase NYN domain-containing protein n=1 Tax=Perkinsus olseni TaxID=32597 RepID=A0A7J6NVT8_PEROL|nr:hypothetical protein FOZ60_003278 [Perkinsus olseni]
MNDGSISTSSEEAEDPSGRPGSKPRGYPRPLSPVERLDYYETALTGPDKERFVEAVRGKAVGKIWKIVYEEGVVASSDTVVLSARYDPLSDTMNALRSLDNRDDIRYEELKDQLRLQAKTVRMYFADLRRRIVDARGKGETEALRLLDGRLEVVFGDLERYVGTFVDAGHLNLAIEHYERCLLFLGSHRSPAVGLLSITAGLQHRRLAKVCYDLLRGDSEPEHLISKIESAARHLAEVPDRARPFAKAILSECAASLRGECLNPEPLKLAGLVMVDEPSKASPGTWHWLVLLTAALTLSMTGEERGPVKSLISSIGAALALEPVMEASRISKSALWCSLLLCLEFMGPHWHGDVDLDGIVEAHCAKYAVSVAEEPWESTVDTDVFRKGITPAEPSENQSATMASRLVQICLHLSTKRKTRGEPVVEQRPAPEKAHIRRARSAERKHAGHNVPTNHRSSTAVRRRTDRWGNLLSEDSSNGDSANIHTSEVRSHRRGEEEKQPRTDYKPLILIDGPNVANRHGGQQFTCKGLQICVDYYTSRGHEVMVFLPDYLVNRNELFRLRNAQKMKVQTVHGIKAAPTHIPVDNIGILLKLQTQGRLALTPSKDYDDSYCLQYALKKDAVIVSNDMYRDWVKKQPFVEKAVGSATDDADCDQ